MVTPYLNVRGRISWGTYFQTLANDGAFLENRLQKTSSAYQNTLATEAYPGQEVYAHTYIGYTQAQNISTAINAEDLLIKFDTGLLELPDTEQWTALAVGTNADISNGTAKLRYAARKDGSLWGSVTDMVTVNPYLGTDGVKPFIDACNTFDKGIFVLDKTSNPSSGEFQDRELAGEPLYERVAEKIEEWGSLSMRTI